MIIAFTDASYNNNKKIAVIGFYIRGEEPITDTIQVNGIALAEKIALERCHNYIREKYEGLQEITIYTDHFASLKILYPLTTIVFIKGHKKKALKSDLDQEFSVIDKLVRKKLRALIK